MTEVDLSMTESIFSRNTSILNDKAHIREILQSQNLSTKPILHISSVNNLIVFNIEDLHKIFQMYGNVIKINVLDDKKQTLLYLWMI